MTQVSLPHSRHTSWIGVDKFGFCIVLLFFQLLLLEQNDEADYLPSYTYIPRMLLPWNQPVQFISIFYHVSIYIAHSSLRFNFAHLPPRLHYRLIPEFWIETDAEKEQSQHPETHLGTAVSDNSGA